MVPRIHPRALRPRVLYRRVSDPHLRIFLERYQRVNPGVKVDFLTDAALHESGLVVVRVQRAGQKPAYHVRIARKDVGHEMDHARSMIFAHEAGFAGLRSDRWMAVLIEFGLPTQQRPFSQRTKVNPDYVVARIKHGLLRNHYDLTDLNAYISRQFPSDSAFRHALYWAIKSPSLRPHFNALNEIPFSRERAAGYINIDVAVPHVLPVVEYLLRVAKRAQPKR